MQKSEMVQNLVALVAPRGEQDHLAEALRPVVWPVQAQAGAQVRISLSVDHLVYVHSGATKLVAQAADGEDHVLAFQFPGELVTVPASGPYTYMLYALKDSELAVLDQDELIKACSDLPDALTTLLGRAMRALNRCRDGSILLSRRSANERVAGFIHQISERLKPSADAEGGICLPMTRREMGEALGLTVETVSREFSRLRAEGLIETRGRAWLRVIDGTALAERAGLFAIAA